MTMGYYEIKRTLNGRFHFNLKAGNGEVILSSEMYASHASVENGILSVQTNAVEDAQYELCCEGEQPYFLLKAKNHQVIGHSEHYSSENAARKGIQSVKKNAQTRDIRDLSRGQ
ncbi:YegP family protein [Edwardsiella piscicida]|uniref:YegP family protein n=1 Tax=Edwardsiella piscicida TaxID=1263550 RepID=UPI0020C90137|nr:YegP family protein [Edwardsiella piscicida]WAM45690.1 YegP family protein [Edwardsiella piscicida]